MVDTPSAPVDELAVVQAWDRGPVLSAALAESGTINRMVFVETRSGRYVLRAYRHRDCEPVAREHEVIAYACARDVPAVAPIPLPDGSTILARGGRFYALFPYASGYQLSQHELGAGEAAAMGAFLADLHRALAGFPRARAARRSFAVDRAATLAGIGRLEAAIQARPELNDLDRYALARLADRRRWLTESAPVNVPDFAALEQQLIHGDYQETNLFFESGQIVAIIDWDQTYLAPRAWEVVRTMHLALKLEAGRCRALLAAYRAKLPLGLEELDLAAAGYSLVRAHDLWIYEAVYLEGNDRVRRFITLGRGRFVPFAERWAALRAVLC